MEMQEHATEGPDSVASVTSVPSVLRSLTVGSHGGMDLPLSPRDGGKSVPSVLRRLTVGSISHGSMDLSPSPRDGEKTVSRGRLSTRFLL